jgi:hypothetical protein
MKKAVLIDAVKREIKEVDVNDYRDICPLLNNCRMFTIGHYLNNGNDKQDTDVIYVDDEGLLTDPKHFFTFEGGHQPYAGNGLVVGSDFKGESADVLISVEEVKNKVKFLSPSEALLQYT